VTTKTKSKYCVGGRSLKIGQHIQVTCMPTADAKTEASALVLRYKVSNVLINQYTTTVYLSNCCTLRIVVGSPLVFLSMGRATYLVNVIEVIGDN